ncbi:uncharacterized protein METZ01_LOCUS241211 [marine metagenome]|uniref:Uncharacterized protein n=1 Tax=marine metagenome TaxID=408172 RepID=A0A382HN44_9ZZZZ
MSDIIIQKIKAFFLAMDIWNIEEVRNRGMDTTSGYRLTTTILPTILIYLANSNKEDRYFIARMRFKTIEGGDKGL